MLQITIPAQELWDEKKEEFITVKECTLQLEHSLVSVSKWEAKWRKVFLSKKDKTRAETIDYIRCMTITQNVNPDVYRCLTKENIEQIQEHVNAPMKATWFSDEHSGSPNNEQITSELIYYWMIAQNIPFECQKWHLNRLLTLIRVCSIKNKSPKKMSKGEIMKRNASLNAARRKQFNTKG